MKNDLSREVVRYSHHLNQLLDRTAEFIAPRDIDPLGSPVNLARKPIQLGVWLIVLIFGVFGIWAAVAPLYSAAVAQGQIVVDTNRKTIQHLEGGIIDEILVKEGEHVAAGQALIRLNATSSSARVNLLNGQYVVAKATEARLIAERDGKDEMVIPKELLDQANDKAAKETIESQKRLFESRRAAVKGQVDVLGQKIKQSKEEIGGLEAQQQSAASQIKLLDEEISVVQTLLDKGNAVKPRLLALQRQAADLKGKRGEYIALIARARQTITEAEYSIMNQKNDFQNRIAQELKDTQVTLSDLQEKIRASADIMDRVVITSPIEGTVTGLNVHTKGGVITPGEKIMDIVPSNAKLIVEAQVSPSDIDVVHQDLKARVRLTAYKSRNVPLMEGRVLNVSADRFTDPRSGQAYFMARIEIDPESLKKVKNVEPSPGMPADVLIVTGRKTVLSYLLDPISDTFLHAFREQ